MKSITCDYLHNLPCRNRKLLEKHVVADQEAEEQAVAVSRSIFRGEHSNKTSFETNPLINLMYK